MAKYRLLKGSHGRSENGIDVSYVAGQVMDLSHAEATGRSLKGRIELVAGDDDSVDLSLMSPKKAASLILKLETMDEVVAFQGAEVQGKNRKPVLEAAEKRLQELAAG